jgi:dihydrodipicolinate synthase/N-acetylneuraminate lyase
VGDLGRARRLTDEPLGRSNRLRSAREKRGDHPLDGSVEVGRHLVDEPDPKRGPRVEALAGQEEAPRRARSDPGQDERGDDGRHDSKPHLGEPEHGVLAGDRHVGARGQAASATERVAVDSRHDGRRAGVDRVEHPVEAHGVLDVLVVGEVDRRALPVHVRAGTEARPVPREHDRTGVADVRERVGELGDQRGVERVAALRAGQRDPENGAFPLDPKRAHPSELRVGRMLKGALAATVTPLRDRGDALDEAAFAPYVDFLAAGGLQGLLTLGTTGEGILLRPDERRLAAETFVEAAGARLDVAVHCGAQTTRDTVALAAHAAEIGAAAVAVIGPPYYALDEDELVAHFSAAAGACAPLPFYVYEFAARTGYAVPIAVVERLREAAPNLAGLKVSDSPFARFSPYLLEGLDVFVGPEALIPEGLARGAVGAVSGLAAAFPELVAAVVRDPSPEAGNRASSLRAAIQQLPFQAALKRVLARRGVPVREDVRAPLRGLSAEEVREADALADSVEAGQAA